MVGGEEVVVSYWWLLAPLAGAQEPATEEPASVLVTTLQTLPTTRDWPEDEVRSLQGALVSAFARRHDLVSLDEVPPFEVHGYGPELYMQSCPPGRYAGCALVIGQRASAPWAVGGTLEEIVERDGSTSKILRVAIVDVTRTVELARFSVVWRPEDQSAIAEGIVRLFDELRPEAGEARDLREDGTGGLDPAARARVAASLEALENELGVAIAGEVTVREPEKVTRASLDRYRRQEGPTPWDQLGMREREYVRFRNSGDDLETWRRAARGRRGQLIVRVSGGINAGPWHQNSEGQLLRSGFTLEPVHVVQYVEAVPSSSATGTLELGFGVLPFLELSATASRRSSQATLLRDEQVQGQAQIPSEPESFGYGTTQWGGRVTVAPLLLHRFARPVAVVGVYGWRGRAVGESEEFPRLDAPRLTVAEMLVGGEVDATPELGFTARFGLDVPLGGRWTSTFESGSGLEVVPRPSGDRPLGWTLQFGVQVRATAFRGRRP